MDNSQEHFLHFYQNILFRERNADSFERASIHRKCLGLMFKASIPLTNNATTCSLYRRNLESYADIVDDQNDVNNYAESIRTLLSSNQVQCDDWKSSLDAGSYQETFHCSSHEVTEEDIEFLINESKFDKPKDENICPTISSNSMMQKQTEIKLFFNQENKGTDVQFGRENRKLKNLDMSNEEKKRINNMTLRNNSYGTSRCNQIAGTKTSPDLFRPQDIICDSSKPSNVVTFNTLKYNNSFQKSAINLPKSIPSPEENGNLQKPCVGFMSASEALAMQNQKKWGSKNSSFGSDGGAQKKILGTTRRSVMNKFVPPVKPSEEESGGMLSHSGVSRGCNGVEDESLKTIDPKMVELIRSEIMESGAPVDWDDIAGLQFAKATIQEIVVWPMLRPDIFTGLRRPPKGILLFGPPGTGKTLIGKCIASQSRSTFFSISASSLTSKWIGDGEKMVRALFAVARCHQPAVIFIDEIDSLLTQRSETEHESSRRIKTEFLVQLDGATTGDEDRILVVGATNRPQELDEAARRRLVKRLYIPLPDHEARCQIVQRLMCKENNSLTQEQINEIGSLTEGYSGADVKNLCQEASLGPIRSISLLDIQSISPEQVRPIIFEDFQSALKRVRTSVSARDLDVYLKWDKTYGSG